MNDIINSKCEKFNTTDLVYHSSEQFLMLCLKICNLIIKNKCDIKSLVEIKRSDNLFKRNVFNNDSMLVYATSLFYNLNETECIKYGHKESYKLSLFICGILLCLIILILNGLTLITIIRSRRLHSITNILIANLSISDFLSGIAFLYPCVLNLLTINALETYNSYLYTIACNIRQYYYVCLAGYSPMITSMLSSMLTLTLLALEKYLAIVKPYMYKRFIHERKYLCYLCLVLTWSISIIVSLLPIMGWNEHQKYSSYRGFNCKHSKSMPCMFERIFTLSYILLFTSICLLCACTMLAIYIHIYIIARKHSKQIAHIYSFLNKQNIEKNDIEMNDISATKSDLSLNEQNKIDKLQIADQLVKSCENNEISNLNEPTISSAVVNVAAATTKSINHSMKTMKTLLILLLGFYVCWLPLITYFLTFASQKYNNLTIYILMFVACCNAMIDPIVYAFRNRDFRNGLLHNFK